MRKYYEWIMRLNFKQVEAFQAAARLGSATAAAEALHVTQPAVSRMIGDLERAVGFALFERRGRGMQPTADGLLLYEEVQRAFQGLDRVAAAAEAIRGHGRGQEVLQTGKLNVEIRDIIAVGNYAIQLVFDDGHDSGIYSWRYLR